MDKLRMVGLDLDGTLLNKQKKLGRYSIQKIKQVQEMGIQVVPVTGRPREGVPQWLRELFAQSYMITSNGAVTTSLGTGVEVDHRYMEKQQIKKVMEVLEEEKSPLLLEVFACGYGYVTEKDFWEILRPLLGTPMEAYMRMSRKPVPALEPVLKHMEEEVANISVVTADQDSYGRLEKRFGAMGDLFVTSSVPLNVEISHFEADKGSALLRLGEKLQIPPGEIMACGDGLNDISMLEKAGLGVAMGNASVQVQAAADVVTGTNEEEGVATALEKYILNSYFL